MGKIYCLSGLGADERIANSWVADGGHMMVYNRAAEISRIIEQEIAEL